MRIETLGVAELFFLQCDFSFSTFMCVLLLCVILQYLQTFIRFVHFETTCQSLPSRTELVHVLAQSSALLKESGLQPHLFAQLDDSGLPSGSVSCCPPGCATKPSNSHYHRGLCCATYMN